MKKRLLFLIAALTAVTLATTGVSWAAASGPGTGNNRTQDTEPLPPPPPPPK